jgi:hypothetical protein
MGLSIISRTQLTPYRSDCYGFLGQQGAPKIEHCLFSAVLFVPFDLETNSCGKRFGRH